MGDFFHGWRRKIGVAILLIACAVLFVWARGVATGDCIGFIAGDGMYFVSSTDHGFEFRKSFDPPAVGSPPIWWNRAPLYSAPMIFPNEGDLVIELPVWNMFHWAIVLPPTILSAYLILLPPRQRTRRDVQ